MSRQPADDDPNQEGSDPVRDLIRFGAQQYGLDPDDVEDTLDSVLGNDVNLTQYASAGYAFGEASMRARSAARVDHSQQTESPAQPVPTASNAPSAQVREVHEDNTFIGLRVIVSDPHAAISPAGNELVISGDGYHITEPVGFEIGAVEPDRDSGDGVAAVLVRPAEESPAEDPPTEESPAESTTQETHEDSDMNGESSTVDVSDRSDVDATQSRSESFFENLSTDES